MSKKCPSCGCTELEVDPTKGDSYCTECGTVVEESVMVSAVQFQNNDQGGSSAIGQFVGVDSTGLEAIRSGLRLGRESREVTLQNARRSITNLAQALRMSSHNTDVAFNFYRLALCRRMTQGRIHSLTVAACIYLTCRTERTAHLLIDVSDAAQVSVYALGSTYMRIAQALHINIPAMDPSIYVLRFSSTLGFGDQTHKVSETASRIVKRMMKDSIHSGRRPSGLCGAALLIAARLNNFNRTVGDIVKIVKVHSSTVNKRLMEFGQTPSSALSLDEFMTVDLEEEEAPPSFHMARNQEKLQEMLESKTLDGNFSELQLQIEKELEDRVLRLSAKRKRGSATVPSNETADTEKFIKDSMLDTINECIPENILEQASTSQSGLGPNIESFGLAKISECMEIREVTRKDDEPEPETVIPDFDEIDDDEINGYIMSETEAAYKANLWDRVNAEYLKEQKEKAEKLAREKAEGKPEKKKRKTARRKSDATGVAKTAGEAIKNMLQEKKLSNKINYDILKNLDVKLEKVVAVKLEAKKENIVPIEEQVSEAAPIDDESDFDYDTNDDPPKEKCLLSPVMTARELFSSDSEGDY